MNQLVLLIQRPSKVPAVLPVKAYGGNGCVKQHYNTAKEAYTLVFIRNNYIRNMNDLPWA